MRASFLSLLLIFFYLNPSFAATQPRPTFQSLYGSSKTFGELALRMKKHLSEERGRQVVDFYAKQNPQTLPVLNFTNHGAHYRGKEGSVDFKWAKGQKNPTLNNVEFVFQPDASINEMHAKMLGIFAGEDKNVMIDFLLPRAHAVIPVAIYGVLASIGGFLAWTGWELYGTEKEACTELAQAASSCEGPIDKFRGVLSEYEERSRSIAEVIQPPVRSRDRTAGRSAQSGNLPSYLSPILRGISFEKCPGDLLLVGNRINSSSRESRHSDNKDDMQAIATEHIDFVRTRFQEARTEIVNLQANLANLTNASRFKRTTFKSCKNEKWLVNECLTVLDKIAKGGCFKFRTLANPFSDAEAPKESERPLKIEEFAPEINR